MEEPKEITVKYYPEMHFKLYKLPVKQMTKRGRKAWAWGKDTKDEFKVVEMKKNKTFS
jgi:hypothetical protein